MERAEQRGFSLIELMIAVVIIGVLVAIALPNYQTYLVKSARAAAQAQMMDIANRQQQFLLANRAYADKTTLEASGYALPSDVSNNYGYSITVAAGTPPSFTITFTASSSGQLASDGGGALTLNSEGTKSPSGKW